MPTISLCMIVKNEEKVLRRCLDSIRDLMDEIIIVDTGSQDKTKAIAAEYTDKIYDFTWVHDFSAARNFAFSKAGSDYIYSADADEVLDEENREKFRELKQTLLPEIEIVQMYYGNQLSHGTIYNFDKELRPKLFKRLRTFCWEEPIHEAVRLFPVVFDSEIVITHLPEENHSSRDFSAFCRMTAANQPLSKRLKNIYAKELFISGLPEDFLKAEDYFTQVAEAAETLPDELKEAVCVIVRAAGIRGDYQKLFRYAIKDIAEEGVSEVCLELGEYYYSMEEYKEAAIWFYNAAYETHSILNIHCEGDLPRNRLGDCYEAMGMKEQAGEYRQDAKAWAEEIQNARDLEGSKIT